MSFDCSEPNTVLPRFRCTPSLAALYLAALLTIGWGAAAFAQEELEKLIWAFTPETAGDLAMSRNAQDISRNVLEIVRKVDQRPVLYGGGVTPENGKTLIQLSGVAGILLGKGCLDGTAFAQMINQM